ncbi:response regulator transcription factor [Lacisediminihabitans sp. H27-G8]|uniref:response regulator transcription factor n=1 Tax=Lacisediminihabitans sp. H27-G8 TaxID=3111909 RepID=UPI0038FC4493
MTRVLLAEDEVRISGFVQRGLRSAGFLCTTVGDGAEALYEAQSGHYDLVLLDVGLPGLDGFEVLRALRVTDPHIPVIMLTARHASEDIVSGLDGGANDYITKPFKFDELLARVRLRLRERPSSCPIELERGQVRLNPATRRAFVGDVGVDLSAREFALATEFFQHPGQVLSEEQLVDRVWGRGSDSSAKAVGAVIATLRSKLGTDLIETVRGAGFRLN